MKKPKTFKQREWDRFFPEQGMSPGRLIYLTRNQFTRLIGRALREGAKSK